MIAKLSLLHNEDILNLVGIMYNLFVLTLLPLKQTVLYMYIKLRVQDMSNYVGIAYTGIRISLCVLFGQTLRRHLSFAPRRFEVALWIRSL